MDNLVRSICLGPKIMQNIIDLQAGLVGLIGLQSSINRPLGKPTRPTGKPPGLFASPLDTRQFIRSTGRPTTHANRAIRLTGMQAPYTFRHAL